MSEQLLKDRREDDARQMKKFERYFKTDTNSGDNHNKPAEEKYPEKLQPYGDSGYN